MCRHNVTALNVVSFLGLIASTIACVVSFCWPYWMFYPSLFNVWRPIILISNSSKSYPFDKALYRGLWAVGFRDDSFVWFWSNNFESEKTLPGEAKTGLDVTQELLLRLLFVECLEGGLCPTDFRRTLGPPSGHPINH